MTCFDTHCHYNLEPLFSGQAEHFRLKPSDPILTGNWQQHWQTAQKSGVIGAIVVGADLANSHQAIKIHQQQPELLASVGIHPETLDHFLEDFLATQPTADAHQIQSHLAAQIEQQVAALQELTKQHRDKIVAIGETGCDYYYFGDDQTQNQILRQAQLDLFTAQIKLANEFNLPLIVHTRDKQTQAYLDALALIKKCSEFRQPFVLHCVSGPGDYIKEAVSLGGYVGFDGNLTYKHNEELLEILVQVPADQIVVETDAPYLPPMPYRGQICEPWMVTRTCEFVCQTKQIDETQLLANTTALFGLGISALVPTQSSR